MKDCDVVAALTAGMDEDHAKALIDHRRALRKPLTAHAAELLLKRMQAWGDPNAAVDEMLVRGWQGFDADWLKAKKDKKDAAREIEAACSNIPAANSNSSANARRPFAGLRPVSDASASFQRGLEEYRKRQRFLGQK